VSGSGVFTRVRWAGPQEPQEGRREKIGLVRCVDEGGPNRMRGEPWRGQGARSRGVGDRCCIIGLDLIDYYC